LPTDQRTVELGIGGGNCGAVRRAIERRYDRQMATKAHDENADTMPRLIMRPKSTATIDSRAKKPQTTARKPKATSGNKRQRVQEVLAGGLTGRLWLTGGLVHRVGLGSRPGGKVVAKGDVILMI
jgi:hypothetical protein